MINGFLGRIAFSRNDFAAAAAHLAMAGYLLSQDAILFVMLVQSDLEIGKSAEALSLVSKTSSQQLPLRRQFELGLVLAEHNYFEQAAPLFETVQARVPALTTTPASI